MATIVRYGESPKSYFQQQRIVPNTSTLVSTQVGAGTPQAENFTLVTDPIIPDKHLSTRLDSFDPELYDLSENSTLTKLLQALLGASGVGGVRRQMIISRLAGAMSSSHFLDLDQFYGPLFGIHRLADETIDIDPTSQTASPTQWDSYSARDASYRSRITEFGKALNLGPTRIGIEAVARAVLRQEVRVFETWMYNGRNLTPDNNTWGEVSAKYGTWGAASKDPWYTVAGITVLLGASPRGNFSETVILTTKAITEEERHELMLVLDHIKPSGVVVSVMPGQVSFQDDVPMTRNFAASSEYWDIVSVVNPDVSLVDPASGPIYNGTNESSRPAFAEYSGEKISYVSTVSSSAAYQMDGDFIIDTRNAQTVVYPDGIQIDYVPDNGITSSDVALASRLTAPGIMTSYPYPATRKL